MTDQIDAQDEREEDALGELKISDLRKFAKIMGITSQSGWKTEDYLLAIKQRQEASGVNLALGENAPKPGYSRILVHRDPTPGHKNTPIHVGVNGQLLQVPRGVEVEVPTIFVEALNNAMTTKKELVKDASRDNPAGVFEDVKSVSYPFTVIATTPGKYVNPHDGRAANYARREEFWKRFGRWPTAAELIEAMKQKIIKEL